MAWGQVTRWLHLSIAGRHILGTCDCPIYYPFHGLQLSKAYTQLCPKRDHVSSEARCLHQALHLSMCRKLLRHDWHLQDACRSLPQQLSLHGGWHTYACVEIFLVDLRDFQLLGTHHLEIPSSAIKQHNRLSAHFTDFFSCQNLLCSSVHELPSLVSLRQSGMTTCW